MKRATQCASLRGGTVWKGGDTTYTSSLSLAALNPVLAGSSRIFAKHLAPMPTGNGGEDEWVHRKIMNNKNNFSHIFKMFITPWACQKLDLTLKVKNKTQTFSCGSVGHDFKINTGAYSQLDAPRIGLKEMFVWLFDLVFWSTWHFHLSLFTKTSWNCIILKHSVLPDYNLVNNTKK